jgi:asparagine synthase (glutamine-hydrolysing)
VHGYEQWGIEGLVERINGMFAFAIWDARRRALHLVRDRLGKKPLYYRWHEGRFAFASELKALWVMAAGDVKVRLESVARFLYWSYVPGRDTIYESVYQLLPACVLTITPTGTTEHRYWRPSFARKVRAPLSELVHETDAILTAAVKRRLRSDVPLGAFLSGGVDSGYVVSRMAAASSGQVRTFSMGTSDDAHDERNYARQVALHCGTEHTEFEVTADASGLLPSLVWEFGQPFADPACIPTYYVSQHARQYVTVALTGDGGDESFAGYSHHLGRYLTAWMGDVVPTKVIDGLLQSTGRLADSGNTRLASAARCLRYAHPDPVKTWAGAERWDLARSARLWSSSHQDLATRDNLIGYALEVDSEFDGDSPVDRALHHDLRMLLPFSYNPKVDVATMMSSLEARCPFQDREVVEWAARLPAAVKIRPWETKALLKRVAVRWLPREVVYRPKHGFSLPVDRWFRGPWSRMAHEVIFSDQARDRGYFNYPYLEQLWVQHITGSADHGARLWALLWLELWMRIFVDRSVLPDSRPMMKLEAAI